MHSYSDGITQGLLTRLKRCSCESTSGNRGQRLHIETSVRKKKKKHGWKLENSHFPNDVCFFSHTPRRRLLLCASCKEPISLSRWDWRSPWRAFISSVQNGPSELKKNHMIFHQHVAFSAQLGMFRISKMSPFFVDVLVIRSDTFIL